MFSLQITELEIEFEIYLKLLLQHLSPFLTIKLLLPHLLRFLTIFIFIFAAVIKIVN